jgi:ABC-2 type transport system ATP-binding protein
MSDAAPPVLAVQDLTKTYRSMKKAPGLAGAVKALVRREHTSVTAVAGLSFAVQRGEFVGLLGPNGAGKTTTLKMLTGLIRPSSGRAVAFGEHDTSARRPAYLRRIGLVMGQRNQLNADLPAIDSFRLAQAIYDLEADRFQARLDLSLDLFGMRALLTTPVRKLSLGERMKMELILALLHEPELLFLDEPTIGLDFNAARHIRGFLAEANRKLGVTVILTSHYAKDIEELCRRVVLINHGRIVYDDSLATLSAKYRTNKYIRLVGLNGLPGSKLQAYGEILEKQTDSVLLKLPTSRLSEVVARLVSHTELADMTIEAVPLEEIISDIFER